MVVTAVTSSIPDPIVLLLAHMASIDQELHQGELNAIRTVAERYGVGPETHAACDEIFGGRADPKLIRSRAHLVPLSRRTEAFELLVEMAFADGVCVEPEQQMLQEVGALWGFPPERIKAMCDSAREAHERMPVVVTEERAASLSARLIGITDRFFSRQLVDRIASVSEGTKEGVERLRREFLLDGPGYQEAVKRCADIARIDFRSAHSALEVARSELRGLTPALEAAIANVAEKSSRKSNTAQSLKQQFESTRNEITREAEVRLANVERSTTARQRALMSFSVAFMGRTKAGKSTLHAIVTGDGWDGIGGGAQRTTRMNRVYEWRHMRIIDTPGIGAPGGLSDEEIATRVVAEADVVCYVVTNDSQQETEFIFLKMLKEHAKPLLILLNIKENIRDKERLRRFLDKPERPFRSDGPSGLRGHIERIRRYAKEHYTNDYFSIVPVHLLAAQMSREDEHRTSADALMRASRLPDFLDGVRTSLIEMGPLRRSQTLLAGTIGELRRTLSWLSDLEGSFRQTALTVRERAKVLPQTLSRAADDVTAQYEGDIRAVFSKLRLSVDSFAEVHWQDSAEALNDAWSAELQRRQVETEVQVIYQTRSSKYGDRVQEVLDELGRDLELKAQLGIGFDKMRPGESGMFWKNLFRWGGQVVGVFALILGITSVVAPPVAAAIGAVGALMTLASRLFESRDKKRARAVAHIATALREQIDKQEQQVIIAGRSALHRHSQTTSRAINDYFLSLIEGLEAIASSVADAKRSLAAQLEEMERAYAKRVLDWMTGRDEPLTRDSIERDVASVSYLPGQHLAIKTRVPMRYKHDLALLCSALQHDVKIDVVVPHHKDIRQ